MGEARLEVVLSRLRDEGVRVTLPRRAIVTALLDAGHDHVTAEDLTAQVQAEHPDVHASTVYRTLDTLERLEVVYHVHLAHRAAVYHLAEDAHLHLVCASCGAVVEVPEPTFRTLADGLHRGFRFTPEVRHFALSGHCDRCSPPDPH